MFELELSAYGKRDKAERDGADYFYVTQIGLVYEIKTAGTYDKPRDKVTRDVGKLQQLYDARQYKTARHGERNT